MQVSSLGVDEEELEAITKVVRLASRIDPAELEPHEDPLYVAY